MSMLLHILALSSLYRFVMHGTSSAALGLMLFTLTIWSYHFLFMRKSTPAWPLLALQCIVGGRFVR